jgi:hypothetical protein
MDAPTKALAREWRDFCSAGGAEVGAWWQAYTAVYEAAFKWAKKPTHAPFSYQLLVTMLALGVPLARANVVPFATTHRAIRFVVFEAKVRGAGAKLATSGRRWVTPRELPDFALSNAAKRIVT